MAAWFEERFGVVVDVAFAFDDFDLVAMYVTRGRLMKNLAALKQANKPASDPVRQSIETHCDQIDIKIAKRAAKKYCLACRFICLSMCLSTFPCAYVHACPWRQLPVACSEHDLTNKHNIY
jgi:hypothetical protein